MPITKPAPVDVNWAATPGGSVPAGGVLTSDSFALNAAAIGAMIQLEADGVAAGDLVEFYALYSLDGVVFSDESVETATYLGEIDANANDQGSIHVPIDHRAHSLKIYAVEKGGVNAVSIAAKILQQLG